LEIDLRPALLYDTAVAAVVILAVWLARRNRH
jgi:hypothetical protein